MKIKQVEELVGITKKNIRFYEDQGLLAPGRADNGYREYHEEDIRRLKQIKFLRKLYVPIEEIRLVLSGAQSLEACLEKQTREISRQRENLDEMEIITRRLLEKGTSEGQLLLDQLDVDGCLENIKRLEREGKEFMDVNVTDVHRKKTIGSVIGASIMIVFMAMLTVMIWWGNTVDPLPTGLFLLIICIPVIIIICTIAVLIQRIKEIEGGEEDEASKY